MSRTLSDMLPGRVLRGAAVTATVLSLAAAPRAADAQMTPTLFGLQDIARILSSEVSLSSRDAGMRLELEGNRALDVMFRDGALYIGEDRIADVARGSELDRSWRELLTQAMDVPAAQLPQILADWTPPAGDAGARLEAALDAALAAQPLDAAAQTAVPDADSVSRLVERISELEATLKEREARPLVMDEAPPRRHGPLHYITEGIAGIFALMIVYAVLFAIAFGVIFFGGRKYIEGVADTARHAMGRSLLVGMAASFLVVPAFFLGMIALVISIVGIPGLLVWVPGFPVAVVLALLLGYLAVGHAIGESFAERRYYVTEWFQRGNSYYFLVSGIGLLLALFFASRVVHMAGPALRGFGVILILLGFVLTAIATTVGFGAVLISRAGTRPVRADGTVQSEDLFAEEAGV